MESAVAQGSDIDSVDTYQINTSRKHNKAGKKRKIASIRKYYNSHNEWNTCTKPTEKRAKIKTKKLKKKKTKKKLVPFLHKPIYTRVLAVRNSRIFS